MFGNETGGETAVTFGFKDKTNGIAQAEYVDEVKGVVRNVNIGIVQELKTGSSREETHALIDEIEKSGDPKQGIRPEDLISLPDTKFFRKRGPEEFVFGPYDVGGQFLTENGKPLSIDGYLQYLATVLPSRFIGSREYNKYVQQMRDYYSNKSSE
jgi:hypothetical protein